VKTNRRGGRGMFRLFHCGGRGPRHEWLGRSGPNLQPGTVRVYIINGSRNGLSTTKHPPSLGSRAGPDLPTNVQAVLRAGITYTRTVPGSRLGPDLPRASRALRRRTCSARRSACAVQLHMIYRIFMHICNIYKYIYIYIYI